MEDWRQKLNRAVERSGGARGAAQRLPGDTAAAEARIRALLDGLDADPVEAVLLIWALERGRP